MAPRTAVEAQFSLPYTIACALVKGGVGIADFDAQALIDPRVVALASKVETYVDPELEKTWSRGVSPARLEVWGPNIQCSAGIDTARGSPKNPFSPSDFARKWRDCLDAGGLKHGSRFVEDLHAMLQDLSTGQSLGPLHDALAGDVADTRSD
jgi:2-methylcitrate dehydratase PrpD